MGFITIENITLSPPAQNVVSVSVAYKLASDPDEPSRYTTVTNDLQVNPDGSLTNGTFYIYGLLDNTNYTVLIFNDCTSAKQTVLSLEGVGNNTTTTHASCDFRGISDLVTWIDFSDLTTLEISDGGIEIAQDKSYNNNDFFFFERSPSTVIGYNGLRGCYFDGESKMRSTLTLSDYDSYTIITVGDLQITRGSDNDGGWSISTGGGAAGVVFDAYGAVQYEAGFYTNPNSFMTSFTIRNQDGNSRIRAYDNGYLTNDVDNIFNHKLRSSSYGIVLGANGTLGNPEIGLTHEILIFNRVLTDAELGVIHNCLRLKYAIVDISPWFTSTTTTLTPPVPTTTSTTTTIQPPSTVYWEYFERGGANSYVVLNTGPVTGLENIREDHPTTDVGAFSIDFNHKLRAKLDLIPGSINPNSYYLKIFNATDGVTLYEVTQSTPIDYTTVPVLSGKTYVVTFITDIVATTTSTTTTLGPANVTFSFENEGQGKTFYNVRSGINGNENLQVSGLLPNIGVFTVPAGHRMTTGLFDDQSSPLDSDFYQITITNVTDSVVIYDMSTGMPQVFVTPPLESGKSYVVTFVVNTVTPLTTTTTLPCYTVSSINGQGAPTTVHWSFSNSGKESGGAFIGVGDTFPGDLKVQVRWVDAVKSGTFYPNPDTSLQVLVSDSSAQPPDNVESSYHYLKILRVRDGAVVFEQYNTAGAVQASIPLDDGETYIVTMITDYTFSDTGYILFNNTDRFDSGSSNLIKHS